MIKTISRKELAEILKKSESTIASDMTRNPDAIPRHFKVPGSRRPLWNAETVDQFLRKHAEEAGALPEIDVPVVPPKKR